MTYFDKQISNLYDMNGTERMNADTESAIENALYEMFDITAADIRVYTDVETHTCRWVYVLTDDPIEYEVVVRLNICKALELDDIDFFD